MTEIELKDYRKILEKEYSAKDLEIETSLSYITIGSLGFFLTINDKFLKLQDAKLTCLLVISLSCLFLSFVLKLWDKSHKALTLIRTLTYFGLSLGIGLQVLYLVLNIK